MARLIDADLLEKEIYKWMPKDQETWMDSDLPPIENLVVSIMMTIQEQPTVDAVSQWIPCNERLPEDDTLMLVNYIDNRPDAMDIWIGWHEMENVWYIDGEAHSREFGNEVMAWMPLPEPYAERLEE